ncbi:IscS subfamily cysteine desulfurase [Halobacillus shinanisalinarum]|uniref:IscS subfamily cysteine desulfurase n=1 Tax=Halobacillus shinanisalinarum TaxID=2932258 RepID=A0ABY4H4J7_9BACI|nr:IscS subfamily cysteine desulfurase [Halobacillus shinanisalinarum]UOQ94502.1 IscS subfamily cysteine desulfurase [Halobacillus shinanisalinarum]
MRYFDYAATCPISEEALQTYIQASKEYFGNTRSVHDIGTKADSLAEHCRQTLAGLLKVDAEGVTFTSGGSESNMLALYALATSGRGKHIVISAGEHSSIHNITAKLAEEEGYEVSKVSLNEEGIINLEELKLLMREDTVLVSIQHVNSDIGTIQPIEEIHKLCRSNGSWLHSDCVQSFGKIDLSRVTSLVDSFSVSSHKIYGPKGVGALYIRPAISFTPFLPNVSHESGVRPGTLNTPGIAAFTTAAQTKLTNLKSYQQDIIFLKREFLNALADVNASVRVMGPNTDSPVPILGLCISEIDGQHMMLEGNRRGYFFSIGSACQVGSGGPPKTLLSMGYSEEEAKTFIRISFGFDQTLEDVRGLAACIKEVIWERERTV